MTAPTVDATSGQLNWTSQSPTYSIPVTLGTSPTSFWVLACYWSTSASVGNITGMTWNGVSMTAVTVGARGPNAGTVEIWCLGAPAGGAHNLIVSFQSNANNGTFYMISFTNTPTSGGAGVQWADITTSGPTTGANSTLSVANNTANDAIIDAVVFDINANPTMGAQTNRVLIDAVTNGNGNGMGASLVRPAPASGSQTLNWTFGSSEHTQTAVRVLGTTAAVAAAPVPVPIGRRLPLLLR